jgi:hypothetical protein
MPRPSKPKKSALSEFALMIVPDRIEDAVDQVDAYFTDHFKLSFDTPEGVGGVLNELLRQNGDPVRKALYALLCDESGLFKSITGGVTSDGIKAGVGMLVPLLISQFALAPAVALLVATLVLKAVAANGQKALCEELAQQHRKTARYIRAADARKKAAATKSRVPGSTKKTGTTRPKTAGKPSDTARKSPAGKKPGIPRSVEKPTDPKNSKPASKPRPKLTRENP